MNYPSIMESSPLQTMLGACADLNKDLRAAWSNGRPLDQQLTLPIGGYTHAVESGIEAQSRWLCDTYRALCIGVLEPKLIEAQIERTQNLTRATLDGWKSLTEPTATSGMDSTDITAAMPARFVQPWIGTLSAWSEFIRRVSGQELDPIEPPSEPITTMEVSQMS